MALLAVFCAVVKDDIVGFGGGGGGKMCFWFAAVSSVVC
jgi:hypothetical protein